jgi:UrcA family protein
MLHPESFKKLAALAVLGAAALAAPLFASASPTSEVQHTKAVQYGDLDLTKPADAQRLYARIKHAAQEVCRNYQWSPVQADCYEAAVAEAVAKVHQPLLSAMVERRSAGRSAHVGA